MRVAVAARMPRRLDGGVRVRGHPPARSRLSATSPSLSTGPSAGTTRLLSRGGGRAADFDVDVFSTMAGVMAAWQVTNKPRTPCRRMLPSVIGRIGSSSLAMSQRRTDKERNQVAVIGTSGPAATMAIRPTDLG
jgi:hypothetical protein